MIDKIKTFRQLLSRAKGGDDTALKQAVDLAVKEADRANKRMVRSERKGINNSAYREAQAFTRDITEKGNRFTKSKKRLKVDIELLEQQFYATERYLRRKGSTITGAKEIEKQVIEQFESIGMNFETAEDKKQFLNFLDSDMWNEFKKYDSGDTIEKVQEGLKQGKKISVLMNRFEQWKSGQIGNLYDVLEGWDKIET